jgi:hypothetical protein
MIVALKRCNHIKRLAKTTSRKIIVKRRALSPNEFLHDFYVMRRGVSLEM